MKPSQRPFIIYKSSAGSGKTYTLTMEYLKLALTFPDSFKSILAVTFTNKATQEMKERIITELKRLKQRVDPMEKMDAEIMGALGIAEAELKMRAAQSLTAILHDYGRFSVSTIDSFFQKVVRAFAREMDLNARFEVELDQDAVLDRVVDRVVAKVMDDAFLHKWLVDYAIEQIQNGKSWDIRKNIKALGKQVFQENFKKFGVEIREFLKEEDNIKKLQNFARERKSELIKITVALKDQANQIRISNGLEWTDFSGGSRSFAKKFDLFGERNRPVPEFTPKQSLLAFSEEGWYTKSSRHMDAIVSAFQQGLGLILSQAEPLMVKWNTLEAISKNIYVYGIFRNLLEELTQIKDEENILLISDSNEFLKEITKENDAPFIYEKVGNQFKNYLIDEFQDTSGFQWASFKPLLENSISQGNTNLLVGDVKQSIYRWRGGELKLLLTQVEDEIGREKIRLENLDTNFRSLPNIIAFNNALFGQLPDSMEKYVQEAYAASDASIISKAYADVAQKVSDRKSALPQKGKVRFEFLENSNETDEDEEDLNFEEMVLAKLPEMVMELQDRGYTLKDIAFLVRRKSEGEAIADALMTYGAEHPELNYSFDVLSDESMFLHKSASVKALLAALKYLHQPDDQVQFKTMWYYCSLLRDEAVNHELFALDQIPSQLLEQVAAFRERESALLQLPLMETLEELIIQLDLQSSGLERAYLSGFKEAVYDFTANNRADLTGFLDWWEENKDKRTVKIPEGHNAMRILTIHKSKGLQFKVVLMPFLKWTIFDINKAHVVWSPFQDMEKQLSAIIPLTLKKELAQSDFKETYAEEAVMAYLDSLNMVYVALTRAEEVIWGLLPYKQKIISRNYLEVHLQQILEDGVNSEGSLSLSDHFDPQTKVFDFGDWPENPEKETAAPGLPQLRWAYQNWSSLLQLRQYAVDFSASGMEQRKKRNFGLLMHEVLEKSESLQDANSLLQAFYFEGRLSQEELGEVESQLDQLFANPLFSSWFETDGVLLSEQGILLPDGSQKRPDRIILKKDISIIVDFKTGGESTRHESQVQVYKDLVAGLTQKPVKGYLCYLESGKIVEVR